MAENITQREYAANAPANGRIRWAWGRASVEIDAQITPTGLLAVGSMVGLILLAVAPIVVAGGKAAKDGHKFLQHH